MSFLYGLDLAMGCSGVTIFNLDTLEPVHISSIKTSDKDTHGKRLKNIADTLIGFRKSYQPSIIVIERAFSRFNTSTAAIYKVHGVTNYLFHDIEQIYYPPKTVKESVIKGDATKQFVRDMVQVAYPNVKFENEDESDSFAVALTYMIKNKYITWDKNELKNKLKKNGNKTSFKLNIDY